jgi:uncharacterized protein YndB with AHSA1/START domain
MAKEVRHTWFFHHPPEDVWEYLTKPELMEQWLIKSDFRPVVGYKFRFTGDRSKDCQYDNIVYCEVLEVQPFTRLAYTWDRGPGNGEISLRSKVEWTLVPKGNGTELQLVHNGFTLLEEVLTHNNGWMALGGRFVELLNSIKDVRSV